MNSFSQPKSDVDSLNICQTNRISQFQSRALNPQANQFLYKFNYLTDHQMPANRNIHHHHLVGDGMLAVGVSSGIVPGPNVDNSNNYFDEPVYEEIVSNRSNYDDYVDDEEIEIHRQQQQQQQQRRVAASAHHPRHDTNSFNSTDINAINDDDDGDDDDDDDDHDDDDDEDDDCEDFGNEDEDLIDENYRIRNILSNTRDNRRKKLKYGGGYPPAKTQPNDILQTESQSDRLQQQELHYQQTQQQQQQYGRNLSAMLDENNTVICYLEPISKN